MTMEPPTFPYETPPWKNRPLFFRPAAVMVTVTVTSSGVVLSVIVVPLAGFMLVVSVMVPLLAVAMLKPLSCPW